MATEPVKLQLRLPSELHAKLISARGDSARSLNAELVERIEASFAADEKIEQLEAVINSLTAASKSHEKVLSYQGQLLRDAGAFIQMQVKFDRTRSPEGAVSPLDALVMRFGEALHKADFAEAIRVLADLSHWAKEKGLEGGDGLLGPYKEIRAKKS